MMWRPGEMLLELPGINDTFGISPDGKYFAAAQFNR